MYNRIKSLNFRHFTIVGLAVLCCTLLSSSVHAVEMSPNVHPIWTNATPDCSFHVYQNSTTYTQEVFNNSSSFWSIDNIYCTIPAGVASYKTYAVLSFMVENIDNNNSVDAGFRNVKSEVTSNTGAKYGVIGVNFSNAGNSSFRVDVYLYGEGTGNINNATIVRLYNPNNSLELLYLQSRERMTVSGYSFWQVDTTDFEYDYTSVLNQINTKLGNTNTSISQVRDAVNSTNSKLDTTNNKLDDLNSGISDLKSLQQEANDDANDRYESEKQEESDREESISGSSEDAQGLFSFSVLNPFSGIFNLFKNDCSANIPIIASWLHAPSSTYTSWWCPIESEYGVRSYLTPVFGIASMMLLFGFVVRWLSNNSGDIYGARNFNKEMNG